MLRIAFSTAVILSVCTVALGQKDPAELARLRIQMGVSETTPISVAGARALPRCAGDTHAMRSSPEDGLTLLRLEALEWRHVEDR